MTPRTTTPERPDGVDGQDGHVVLRDERLAAALRASAGRLGQQADQRWVEVVDDVVAQALTATRRSLPLWAVAPGGPVQVSEQVVVAYLRETVDAATADAAALDISLRVEGRDRLAGVVVQLVARYGEPLLPVADRVRTLVEARLRELLGPVDTPVTVQAMHVHFADVVDGDPHTEG